MRRKTRALPVVVIACTMACALVGCGALPQEVTMERPVTESADRTVYAQGTVVARSPQALVIARDGLVNDPVLSDSPTVFGNRSAAAECESDFTVISIDPKTPCAGADGSQQGIYDVEPGQRVSVEYTSSIETHETAIGEQPAVREQQMVNTAQSVTVL